MASSSTALRKAHYETFYALHVFLFPLVLAMAAFHHPETGWWAWAALILWVVERIWRSGRILRYNCRGALGLSRRYRKVPAPAADSDDVFLATSYRPPPGYAYAELLGGATIRLTYTPAYRVQWVPGQHFLLNIPAISKFTSHPFTCATTTSKPSTLPCQVKMVFLIRTKNGWTKSLWDMVISHAVQRKSYVGNEPPLQEIALPTSGLVLRMFVDGPFGSSVRIPWKDYSSIFIVVGGSGVTFGLSVLEHLCSVLAGTPQQGGDAEKGSVPSTTFRRIRFVWLVREFGILPFSTRSRIPSNPYSRSHPVVRLGDQTMQVHAVQGPASGRYIRYKFKSEYTNLYQREEPNRLLQRLRDGRTTVITTVTRIPRIWQES